MSVYQWLAALLFVGVPLFSVLIFVVVWLAHMCLQFATKRLRYVSSR